MMLHLPYFPDAAHNPQSDERIATHRYSFNILEVWNGLGQRSVFRHSHFSALLGRYGRTGDGLRIARIDAPVGGRY
jgi:hypothetical protein